MTCSPAIEEDNQPAVTTQLGQLFAQPETSMANIEIPAAEDANRGSADNPLPHPDATYGVLNLPVSREEASKSPNKNYGNNTPGEMYASNPDEDKIDDCADDCHTETGSSQQYEQATRNEPREETIESDHAPSRDNPGKSRCRWNCRRKRTRHRTPDGIVIDVDNDIAGTKRSGFKISVISVHNLAPDTRIRSRSSTRIPKQVRRNRKIGNSLLAVFYDGNRDKRVRRIGRSVKREYRKHQRADKKIKWANKISGPDTIGYMVDQPGGALCERQELRAADNSRPFYASDEILDSMKCCHHDAALLEANNARCSISCAGQAYAADGELCCSIFNDEHPMYHVCEQEDYNTDTSDFNPEVQADWTPVGCVHAAYMEGCRCFCDSCGYYPGINMQLDQNPTRAAGLLKHFAPPHWLQREEIGRFGLGEPEVTGVAAEFATEADEYSRDGVGDRRHAVRNPAEVRFVETNENDPGNFCGPIVANPKEFDPQTTKLAEKKKWLRKTDSSRDRFTDTRATTIGDCIEQCRESSERSPEVKGRFAREMDAKWMRNPIGTDDQQLDYKWKRRIAPIDDAVGASVDFKGKRDSKYKSEVAIHVQSRERAKIRKRENLQMLETTSQTRGDYTSANSKRQDYSLWPSLQMGKVWSQVHDTCRNVARFATTNINRIITPKAERSRKDYEANDSLSLHGRCGEICSGNPSRSKANSKFEARKEKRAVGSCEDAEATMRRKPRAFHGRDAAQKYETKKRKSHALHSEDGSDGYRDVVELLPRNETCGHDEAAYPQSRSSGSFTYLEDSAYPGFRSRGGSDGNRRQNYTRSTKDKLAEAAQRHLADDMEEGSGGASGKDYTESQTYDDYAEPEIENSFAYTVASDEFPMSTSDITNVPRNNPPDRDKVQSPPHNPSSTQITKQKVEETLNIRSDGKDTMPEVVRVLKTMVIKLDTTSPLLKSEPIASTSTWEPKESQMSQINKQSGVFRGCTKMKCWKKKNNRNNKNNSRKAKNIQKNPSASEMMQLGPFNLQIVEKSNKTTYVNIQMPTFNAIIAKTLSELLKNGENMNGVQMKMMLRPNNEISDIRYKAGTETYSKNIISLEAHAFDSNSNPNPSIMIAKAVQCPDCEKENCYEINTFNESMVSINDLDENPEGTLKKSNVAMK